MLLTSYWLGITVLSHTCLWWGRLSKTQLLMHLMVDTKRHAANGYVDRASYKKFYSANDSYVPLSQS
ncbi:hypothetical protein XELAEV_18025766mg [Xenopus laevis]|uniref:Uncharacterized protein n=1 Tax=Xenopus laevis TaxID=8355 RepID=A0A974D060_XENLA|nr:hypothetical protein XELAEV_18025766mg [Xenopus laevis]